MAAGGSCRAVEWFHDYGALFDAADLEVIVAGLLEDDFAIDRVKLAL